MPNITSLPLERTPTSTYETTFWIVFILTAILPLIVLLLASICRKSFSETINFNKRTVFYDTQLLRRAEARTPMARLSNLTFYRHRPLPLEVLRICIEIAVLLYILGYVRLVVLLSLWCIFDLAQGLHVLNLVYLKHTPAARSATSLATYISTMYSLLYGFPLGFISKLMWIVWLGSRITLPTIFVPFYIEAVAALVFAVFFMMPNMCWRAGVNGCKSIVTRLQVLLLLLVFFCMWLLVYFNVTVCDAPPITTDQPGGDLRWLVNCSVFFRSWTTVFLPVFILLMVSLIVLLWATSYKGMVYRFLPEIAFMWSESLVFTTAIYSEDAGRGAVLGGTGAAILVSILIAIGVNYMLVVDIVRSLRMPVIQPSSSRAGGVSDEEVKRRVAMRQSALKDYIQEGGKTMLRGTLLRHLKKRDRTKECVVCLESFSQAKETTNDPEKGEEAEEGQAPEEVLGIIRKCGHYFHFNCVWDWIQRQTTCPLCRTEVEVSKDAIKTVHYDDVRYALDRNTYSTVGTVSGLVSKAEPAKSRPPVSGTLFKRGANAQENQQGPTGQRNTAIPDGAFVVGDRATSYKSHTRPSTKHCGICRQKFVTDRQSKDIVVGYLRNCGHFFHCECIDSYVRDNEKCPTCHALEKRMLRRMPSPEVPNSTNEPSSSANGLSNGVNEGAAQVNEERPRHSHREANANGRGSRSRLHTGESQNKPVKPRSQRHRSRGRASGGDLARDSGSTNQNEAEAGPVAGPSRPKNGYIRNPRASGQPPNRRYVHSDDILFAFLADVQSDVKRGRNRRSQQNQCPVHNV